MSTIHESAVDQAIVLMNQGNISGAWDALGQGGDNYGFAASDVTSGSGLLTNIIESYWDQVYGPGVWETKGNDVALDHLSNYIAKIKETDNPGNPNQTFDLPDTQFIEDSYADALTNNGLSKDGAIDLALNQILSPLNTTLHEYIAEFHPGGDETGTDPDLPMPDWHEILEFLYGNFGDRTHENSGNHTDLSFAEAMQKLGLAAVYGSLNYISEVAGQLTDYILEKIEQFGDALTSLAESLLDGVIQAAEFVGDLVYGIFEGIAAVSPLVFDLDDSGTIELKSLANSTTYWDIDADDFAEHSGWVTGGDGLLAIDLNEDGIINNNTELFGNSTGYANGFAALASYDLNHDLLINAEDAVYSDLIMWVDANENGRSEEGEHYSLADLDIVSINLAASTVSQTNQGHAVTHTSTFIVDTGSGLDTRAVHDVWFQHDNANTEYVGDFTVDAEAFFLPYLRGYGILADLPVAMSIDNTGTGNLLELVQDFSELELEDIFTDDSTALDDVKEILFRWAGVDGVSPTDRGPNIDARELEFLEKVTGQPFRQAGFYEDPYYFAAQPLKEAFQIALDNFAARLIAQVLGDELFEGDSFYNIGTDAFEGITGLNLTTLDDLETLAGSQTSKDVFWQNVVRVIDNTIGIENLSGGDETALDDAIYDSDNTLDLEIILESLEWDPGSVTVWGGSTSGADSHTGGSGMDEIYGGYGNDTLNGGAGADEIGGEGDNDTLDGQAGDDLIYGGTGNDTYKYTAGQGWDTFEEYGTDSGDKILFASGIAIGDLTFTRASNYDLLIEIASGVGGGQILVRNQFNTTARIETAEFVGGGSPYNLLTQTAWTLNGTDGNDQLWGVFGTGYQDTIYGGDGDDTIYAYAANYTDTGTNFLYGEDGDDILEAYYSSGVDTLQGGAGNDYASGGGGNDIYIYDTGHDTYSEGVSGSDEIRLAAGIVSGDITYSRISTYDLMINIDGEGSITIKNFYYTSGFQIETLRFSDNSTVTLTSVVPTSIKGTQSADTLIGANSVNDILYGFGGNDTFYGYSGNDTMYGGDGNDTMYGYQGNDTFYGDAGNDYMEDTYDGNDVYVYSGGLDVVYDYTGTDILRLTGSTTINDLTFTDLGSHHKITITASVNEIQLYWVDYSSSYLIETIEFADGFTTTLSNWGSWNNGTGSGETLNGTSGADTIVGKAGADTLNGGDGADAMHGGADNDTLNGGNGADLLHGGTGNDTLYGNDGLDTLFGGAGDDTFVFETSAFNNIDVVKDMNLADGDALDIGDILIDYDPMTDDIAAWISFTNNSGNSQVFVDRDGIAGGYSSQQIALVMGLTSLDAETLETNGNLITV